MPLAVLCNHTLRKLCGLASGAEVVGLAGACWIVVVLYKLECTAHSCIEPQRPTSLFSS